MLHITIVPEVAAKFRELLKEEASEDAVFRIRETKVGGGCKSHMELRVSLDEREDPEEEQELQVEGIPFVVGNDEIDSYGLTYTIFVDENDMPGVSSPMQPQRPVSPCSGKQSGGTGTCPLSQAKK